MSTNVVKTTCGMCQGGCSILAHVSDGKMVKVEGDPEGPMNRGSMCPIGLAGIQTLYHPDRLLYPLKRVGARGEGKWQRVPWDEALGTIADKVKAIREKYGPLAVAVGAGTGRPIVPHDTRFTSSLGTPNRVDSTHICFVPQVATGLVTYGKYPAPDVENARCIVDFGSNVTHARPCRLGRLVIDAWKNGAKLIVVDPYLTPLASKAHIWLQIRPGTDCALALAWLNVIISEKLYDKDFVDKWTSGFDKLAQHVERFTPEWAEPITWVPARKIRQAAELYATTKPAAVHLGVAVEFGVNTTGTVRSLLLLPAVTGNVDISGGNVLWEEVVEQVPWFSLDMPLPTRNQALGGFPLLNKVLPSPGHAAWRAVLTGKPYPIKAVLFHASNPIIDHENAHNLVYQALMKLEFCSVMDLFMTPTAELADIVLPASTPYERDNIYRASYKNFVPPVISAMRKVIEPLGESRDDAEVFIEILERLGLDFGAKTVRERLEQICALAQPPITLDQLWERGWAIAHRQRWKKYETGLLRRDGKPGFNTPTGKVELYSQELEKLEIDPLPLFKEPPESPYSSPDLAQKYPLILSTGYAIPVFFWTQYHQSPWLREVTPEPVVDIHPETAGKLGIRNDDWVYIETPRGNCKQKANLTLGIDPRVVRAQVSWWFPEKKDAEHGQWDANINVVTDSDPPYDPGFGSTSARSLLCRVYRAVN